MDLVHNQRIFNINGADQKEETKWIFPHDAPLALKFEQILQSWRSTCTCIYFISEGEPTCLYMLCMQ